MLMLTDPVRPGGGSGSILSQTQVYAKERQLVGICFKEYLNEADAELKGLLQLQSRLEKGIQSCEEQLRLQV